MYSLKRLQNFLSFLEMGFVYLPTWMSDTSHLNQTVGDKKQRGSKSLDDKNQDPIQSQIGRTG